MCEDRLSHVELPIHCLTHKDVYHVGCVECKSMCDARVSYSKRVNADLQKEIDSLNTQIKAMEKTQDTLFEKVEDLREVIALLVKAFA